MAYYNSYMPQQNGFNNQYMAQPMQIPIQQQMQQMQPMQPMQQMPMQRQEINLQGKSVDSIDVVKAMDIPLDGSISYFPLADGSAIVTKQLQQDGTSKTIIYKPFEEKDTKNVTNYVTFDELDERFKKINNNDLRDEIKNLKKQIKNLSEDLEDIRDIKDRKD